VFPSCPETHWVKLVGDRAAGHYGLYVPDGATRKDARRYVKNAVMTHRDRGSVKVRRM
jgi:hypothetical protein